jgi:hypothetical protein
VARLNSVTPSPLQELGAIHHYLADKDTGRTHRTGSPQPGVTLLPSLHNLTAPKAAPSRSQLFEASIKLSSYAAASVSGQDQPVSPRGCDFSSSNAYYYASIYILRSPTVPTPSITVLQLYHPPKAITSKSSPTFAPAYSRITCHFLLLTSLISYQYIIH